MTVIITPPIKSTTHIESVPLTEGEWYFLLGAFIVFIIIAYVLSVWIDESETEQQRKRVDSFLGKGKYNE